MTLKEYLQKKGIVAEAFAIDLGVTGQAVRNWADKKRHPKPEYITAIESITNGAVRPVDWFK